MCTKYLLTSSVINFLIRILVSLIFFFSHLEKYIITLTSLIIKKKKKKSFLEREMTCH